MRIHGTLVGSRANGPGLRSTVWVQGCGIGCAGCFNQGTWDATGGEEIHPASLADRIIREATEGTEGVTISGGEPLQQALALVALIGVINLHRPDWSIGIFTGYTKLELTSGSYDITGPIQLGWANKALLFTEHIAPKLAFIKYGRFDKTKTDIPLERRDRNLIASENQWVELLSDRYHYADFVPKMTEYSIADGMVQLTGF